MTETSNGGVDENGKVHPDIVFGPRTEKIGPKDFPIIQTELRGLVGATPNPDLEIALKVKRAQALREPNDAGFFDGIKETIREAQDVDDFEEAIKKVEGIDLVNYKVSLQGRHAWYPGGDEMLEEYKAAALLNMQLALYEAKGETGAADAIRREVELRSWGTVPLRPKILADKYVKGLGITPATHDAASAVLERQDSEKMGHRVRIERTVREIKEAGNSPETWAGFILKELDIAETSSASELQRSIESGEKDILWEALDDAIDEIPEGIGQCDRSSELYRFLRNEHRNGLFLKERLKTYYEARKHLNDRYVEITRADGSLTAMGMGKDDVPFEGISYKLQKIDNKDFWIIYHGDQMFPELAGKSPAEIGELTPNVDVASSLWLEAGIANKNLPVNLLTSEEINVINKIFSHRTEINNYYQDPVDGKDKDKLRPRNIDINKFWPSAEDVANVLLTGGDITYDELMLYMNIPTFDNSRNVSELNVELRERMSLRLGSKKGEDLAHRMLTATLTLSMLDKNRTSAQGKSEDRDLMWSERQRIYEYGEKEREPGMDWTIGRLFVKSADQGSEIKDEDADKSSKMRRRKEKLAVNRERGLLVENDQYFEGEFASDFFHGSMVYVPDALVPGKAMRRTLATYIINADGTVRQGGFREAPYLLMGDIAYSGYFGYTLGKAKQIIADFAAPTWQKPEEMESVGYWNKKRDLMFRAEHISPRYIARDFKTRGEVIRTLLTNIGGYDPAEVKKISGYTSKDDLVVISDPTLRQQAIDVIEDPSNRAEIAKRGKDLSEAYWEHHFAKLRTIHALGQIWPGTLDAIEETSEFSASSPINLDQMRKINSALTASRYLEGQFMDQFKYEVTQEMGLGSKLIAGRKKRYRQTVDPSLWD